MALVVRPAVAADWPSIAALLEAEALPRDGARDHLAHFLVAEEGDALVGVGGLEVYGATALLRSLAVRSRGQGLGTRLVGQLLQLARDHGVSEIVLLTTTAAAWFRRFGFVPTTRDAVTAALHASAEFRGACPASATVMTLRLP